MTEFKTNTKRKNKKSAVDNNVKPLTKIVVRRLPPTMTKDTFLEQVQPLPDHDHMHFVSADWTLTVNATCRAYFNFLKPEDVFIFKEKFNGYIFVDAKGNEYPAVVEFAPFPKKGRVKSKKPDRKCNTYEASEQFANFCLTMDTDAIPKLELKSDFDIRHDNQIRMTPLLEFLNDKKSRKREKKQTQPLSDKKVLVSVKERPAGALQRSATNASAGRNKEQASASAGLTKRERPERSEKEKARRAERDKLRREKRQIQIEEKKRERLLLKEKKSSVQSLAKGNSSDSVALSGPDHANSLFIPETKKPAKNNNNSNRRQEKAKPTKPSEKKCDMIKCVSGAEIKAHSEEDGTEKRETKRESRRYSERRIRNKDRPAIQIYQPGKVRDDGRQAAKDVIQEGDGIKQKETDKKTVHSQ